MKTHFSLPIEYPVSGNSIHKFFPLLHVAETDLDICLFAYSDELSILQNILVALGIAILRKT